MEIACPITPPHINFPTMGLLPSALPTATPPPTKKGALQETTAHNIPFAISPLSLYETFPRVNDADTFTLPDSRKKSRPDIVPRPLFTCLICQESYFGQKDSKQVWEEDVENAFMEAIRKIPILGRRKIVVDKKPCGRNELIADFIYRRTGKVRTRKQVSSHIQVLKHVRRDDAECTTQLLTSRSCLHIVLRLVTDISGISCPDTEDFLTVPGAARLSYASSGISEDSSEQCQPYSIPTSPLFAPNYQQCESNVSGLDVAEFCIWNGEDGEPAADHVYAQRILNEDVFRGHLNIDTLSSWETRWPHFADCITNEGSIKGGVLLIQVSLTLPSHEQTLDPANLKTHVAVTVQEPCIGEISVMTRIYTMGQKVLELADVIPQAQTGKLYIPFVQEFWTAFLQGLRNLQEGATEQRSLRKAKTVIGGVTVVQEIWAEERAQRIGLLCWEFGVDEDSKQPISVYQLILPGRSSEASSYETSPTYFPTHATSFISLQPQDEFATSGVSDPAYTTSLPTATFHSSPFSLYCSSSHLHPYSATLQRHSVSPMPTLEQTTSPLMIHSSSASPIGFNGSFGGAEIANAGVVAPGMDPVQSGLGITGLEDEAAWLAYGSPRLNEEWDGF